MQLSLREVEILRDTHQEIVKSIESTSERFYGALFALAPGLRGMFRPDLGDQGMRFMTAIGVVVNYLDAPERLEERLQVLGKGHAALGVSRLHYDPMREALIETFRETLGATWTAEAEAAWRKAFDQLADRMAEVSSKEAETA